MAQVVLRRIRIGIEVNGNLHLYEGMKIAANGTKFANPLQNEATVVISGLNAETRNFLLTETSPFAKKKTAARMTIEVGRANGDLVLLYTGDIVSAEIGLPPELEMTIKAKTNNANSAKVVVTHGRERVKLSQLSREVANNNGLTLNFQAQDKDIGNYSFSGTPAKQIQDLQRAGGVSAFVDDSELVVKDRAKALTNRRRILNERSGMIGLPRADEKGVEVTYLIDGESLLGGQLTIESKLNPSLNGDYVIDELKFDARTHSDEFFYVAKCKRL